MEESSLKKKAAAGVFWAGVSNLVTQFLNMLFGIVLARILLPEDYGVVGMLAIFTAVATTLQEAGFGNALINKPDAVHDDYNSVFWFNVLVSSTIYILLFFLTPYIARFYDVPELKWLGRIVFLGIVAASIGNVHSVQLYKSVRTKQIAISSFICTLLSGLVGIILALSGFSFWGLAVQSVLSMVIRDVLYFHYSGWHPTIPIRFKPLQQFWRHGIRLTLMSLYTVINSNLITVLLGKFYSKADVGYYNQASKWNFMAYSVLSGAVNSVSQPLMVAGAETDEERRLRVFRKMVRLASFISIPSMFCLALVAPEFIHITITDKWDKSIPMLQILSLGAAFIPLNLVYQSFFLSKNRSGIVMVVNCIQISLQLLAVTFFYRIGVLWMVAVVSCLNLGTFLLWHTLSTFISDSRFVYLWRDFVVSFVFAITGMLITYYCSEQLHVAEWILLIFKVMIFSMLYLFMSRISGSDIYKDIAKVLSEKLLQLKNKCKRR